MKKKDVARLETLIDNTKEALTQLVEMLTEQKDAKQETFDNRSEKWQESEAGSAFAEKLEATETLRDSAQTALDEIEGMSLDEVTA